MTAVRLADLLADLSLTSDLGMGHEPETALRTAFLATNLAAGLKAPDTVVRDTFYTSLLLHVGCTAYAGETAALFGADDIAVNRSGSLTNFADSRAVFTTFLPAMFAGRNLPARVRISWAAVRHGSRFGHALQTATCEVAAATARRLGLPLGVRQALHQAFERWDGKGAPRGLAGEAIAVEARIAHVAANASAFYAHGGAEASIAEVRDRSGGYLDPEIVDGFARRGLELLHDAANVDLRDAVCDLEPNPWRVVNADDFDELAAAFGDLADLKSRYLVGHSSGVAALAGAAAERLRLSRETVQVIRRAGFMHDLGRTAVPSGIWDKPGRLTTAEREVVRLHSYHTGRILSRSPALIPIGAVASLHHERLDGSGYPRELMGRDIPLEGRVLAAADAFQAMTSQRPYREALAPERAAAELRTHVVAGGLDGDAVAAVLEASGQPMRSRHSQPAGLTARELEVLRLLARGHSTPDIARALVISPKTADHHVQHIYTKLGVSSRAAAAVFAMEHGLVR